jgi:branched-chain amino acid transport system permease protein
MRVNRLTLSIALIATGILVGFPLWRSGGDIGAVATYLLQTGDIVLIFAIITIGLNVQLGYAGIDNFGVGGFLMVGAYIAGLFVLPPPSSEFVRYIFGLGPSFDIFPALHTEEWLPQLLGVVASALLCSLLAIVLALLTPRLRHDYLAIATIGMAELIRAVGTVEDDLVNGDRGLAGIIGPFEPSFTTAQYQIFFFCLLLVVLLGVYWAAQSSVRSPWGRVLRALREDEIAVAAIGRSAFRFKLQSFVLGAAIMGVGAAMFAYYRRGLTPQDFEPLQGTFLFWVMLIVGGTGNNRGAILGAYIVWALWISTLQLATLPLPDELVSRIPFLRYVLLGVFFIAMLNLRPAGLLPEERRVSRWVERLAAKSQGTSASGASRQNQPAGGARRNVVSS